MRLGQILVRDELVTPDQIDEGLRHQIIHGGRLGSNLVELGHLELDVLARALGRLHQRPAALESHFKQIDLALAERLDREVAASLHLVPLGRTGEGGKLIAVASTDPLVEETCADVGAALGAEVMVAITPELRLLYWLERVYGINRISRFKRISRTASIEEFKEEPTDPERRGYVRTLSDVEEVEAPSQLARIAVTRVAMPLSGEVPLALDASDLSACLRAIRQARSRSRVGQIVSDAMQASFGETFSAGMILVIREGVATGWKGFVRGIDATPVDGLAVPLNDPSLFQVPYSTQEGFYGPPEPPTIIDHRLWMFLGNTPKEIAVLPIGISGRIVCILYVQSQEEISPEHIGDLGELSRSIGAAFTRLIRAALR